MSSGNVFHAEGPACEKAARSQNLIRKCGCGNTYMVGGKVHACWPKRGRLVATDRTIGIRQVLRWVATRHRMRYATQLELVGGSEAGVTCSFDPSSNIRRAAALCMHSLLWCGRRLRQAGLCWVAVVKPGHDQSEDESDRHFTAILVCESGEGGVDDNSRWRPPWSHGASYGEFTFQMEAEVSDDGGRFDFDFGRVTSPGCST